MLIRIISEEIQEMHPRMILIRDRDIGGVEKALQEANPDWSVRRAFTAQIIINHVQARDGEKIDNVEQALDRAVENGVKNLVVQPTHLMHGAEYDELVDALDGYKDKFETVTIAEPLLGEVGSDATVVNEDKAAVAEAITAEAVKTAGFDSLKAAKEDGTAFVFMGHGTSHTAKVTYSQMQTQMKELGYDIESVTNKGYRLISKPDILYGPEIEAYLEEESFCQKVECHDSIDSTNIRGKQLAELGEAEGTLIVADRQTAGRGRRGRNWISESGVGIYMTYVLRPTVQPAHVSGITLLAALAMCEATYQECDVLPQIKWPNDVIIDGKKICGILTEMSSEVQYVHYAVMGIGINANKEKFDETLKDKATSIYLSTGKKVNRAKFTAAFADAFGGYYRRYMQDGDLSAFVEEYDELLANKDKEVIIYHGMVEDATPDKISRGIARGIDKDGALLVEIDGSVTPVMSGEVSIRGVQGYV